MKLMFEIAFSSYNSFHKTLVYGKVWLTEKPGQKGPELGEDLLYTCGQITTCLSECAPDG